ncbi:MAG: hypothetical protein J0H15_10625 [Xanthomonadales bacterium]|nr:hypothetical protein [Xanthomonadales bacterium]
MSLALSRASVRTGLPAALVIGVAFAFSAPAAVGAGPGAKARPLLQKKVEALKESAAENQKKLRAYTWTETVKVTANGRELPERVSICSYGPDGKVHRTPVADTAPAAAGRKRGRLAERVVEKKKGEMKDYMADVSHLISRYVPPDPKMIQKAFAADKADFSRGKDGASLVFRDYALRGDSLTIYFDAERRDIRRLDVASWLDSPQDAVTLGVELASLPDGTHHPARSVLDATARDLHVVTTNSGYRRK